MAEGLRIWVTLVPSHQLDELEMEPRKGTNGVHAHASNCCILEVKAKKPQLVSIQITQPQQE